MSRFQSWCNKHPKHARLEGESGVRNLCRFVRSIGYSDRQYFGQFDGGCYGDLVEFLEDNPGALEAIAEWIDDNYDDDTEGEENEAENDDDEK